MSLVEKATREEAAGGDTGALRSHRAKAAARQARWRARQAAPPESDVRNVTVDATVTSQNVYSGDETRAPVLYGAKPSASSIGFPQTTSSSAPKGAERGIRLPTDWQPNEAHKTEAKALGLTGREFHEIVDEFKNYWLSLPGAKGRKLDWDRTFLNRLRERAHLYLARRNGPNGSGRSPTVQDAIRGIHECAVREDDAGRPGLFDDEAPRPPPLLQGGRR